VLHHDAIRKGIYQRPVQVLLLEAIVICRCTNQTLHSIRMDFYFYVLVDGPMLISLEFAVIRMSSISRATLAERHQHNSRRKSFNVLYAVGV
jgi:tRNA pseudouridine-54 N-methylase